MDAFLHWRTEASTRSLSTQLAAAATVIRDGSELKLPALEIVPGDLVVVNSGDFFPADGVIVAGKDLQAEESTLTGESLPVNKQMAQLQVTDPDMLAVDDDSWGFAGAQLLTGRALLRIVYTGKETLYGEIVTSAVQTSQAITPLQKAIARLVLFLIAIATLICIILASVRYYQGFGFVNAILSAATLAVAALPDEFPVVFTFFLGVGVYRLARKKALVRRAVSVENIGRVTCICSDKTGTITEGRLQLVQLVPSEGIDKKTLLNFATIASRKNSGDPVDFAIHHHAEGEYKFTIPETLAVFPFTEKRKRETAIVVQSTNEYLITTKGAPETILTLSNLTDSERAIWIEHIKDLAGKGCKIIACAYLLLTSSSIPDLEPEANYQFAGLLSFNDPPRKEVYAAVQACRQSNIRILMITGDHPETARAIASQIGLGGNYPSVITASDAEAALQQHGYQSLQTIDVIARAIPSQKLMFVQALQAMGNIVAVTGDGVNDVPALKAADIGIAMGGRGTQSAREVAAIVLLDDNFGSIVNAIAEGRQLFKNLKLSFKYLLMIHIPFVFSAAIIPLLGYPLLYYPIHIV
jgi:Ca2+-transporting ATPase